MKFCVKYVSNKVCKVGLLRSQKFKFSLQFHLAVSANILKSFIQLVSELTDVLCYIRIRLIIFCYKDTLSVNFARLEVYFDLGELFEI